MRTIPRQAYPSVKILFISLMKYKFYVHIRSTTNKHENHGKKNDYLIKTNVAKWRVHKKISHAVLLKRRVLRSKTFLLLLPITANIVVNLMKLHVSSQLLIDE